MTDAPLIELKGVSKSFSSGKADAAGLMVLDSIDLSVHSGEFITIIGPSGAGKSTLLYIMGALDRPSAGEVYFNGRSLVDLKDKELTLLRLKHIGFVFQNYNLIPTLNALENTAVTGIMMPELVKSGRAQKLIEQVGLSERSSHRPNQLSGGEQQRVAIARALFAEPAVLLADEPTGNLDSKAGEDIIKLFRELNKKMGTAVILVTHNPRWAKFSDRTVEIIDGKIEARDQNPV